MLAQPVTAWREETFPFSLTDADGRKLFGFCRRYLPTTPDCVQPRFPRALCVLRSMMALSIFDCLTQPGRLLRLCSKYRWLSFFDAVLDALQRACTRAGLRGMLDLLAALWTVRCRQQWPKPLWMRHGRRREFERVGQLVPQQLTVQREFSVSCVPHRRVPPRSVMPPMPAHNGWRSGRGVNTRATLAVYCRL